MVGDGTRQSVGYLSGFQVRRSGQSRPKQSMSGHVRFLNPDFYHAHLACSKGMYNLYARANNGFAFMSSCLMTMLAAIALSSFVFTADPKGQLIISNFKVYAST